jgi:hypothetical protein
VAEVTHGRSVKKQVYLKHKTRLSSSVTSNIRCPKLQQTVKLYLCIPNYHTLYVVYTETVPDVIRYRLNSHNDSPSAATLKMVLGLNIPVAVPDMQIGSPPRMAAAGVRAESAVSCGCPLSICQIW